MKKTWIIIAIVVVVVLVVVLTITQMSKGPKEIVIGAILPLTGDIAAYGENAKNGITLAVEEINEGGGIDSKKFRVIFEDSQGLPGPGVSAMQKLVTQDKVQVVVGDVTSGVTMAIAPIANQKQVVVLSPGASSPKISEAGDYIFRNWQSDALEAKVMAEYAHKEEINKIAIMYINNEFGKALEEASRKIFPSEGVRILISESFEQNEKDFRTQLVKIKQHGPDAIYLLSYPQETPLVLQQTTELGMKTKFLGVAAFEDDSLIKIAGELAEGVLYTHAIPPSDEDPTVANFKKKYREKYGRGPGLISDTGYDAMRMIALAIRLGNGFTGSKIRDGLYKIKDFPGASGVMTFDENGDVFKPIGLKTVKNGEFVWLSK